MNEIDRKMLVECLTHLDSDTNVYGMCGSGKTSAIQSAINSSQYASSFGETFKKMNRMSNFPIHPVSLFELQSGYPMSSPVDFVDELMIYGCFPEVLSKTTFSEKQKKIINLYNNQILPSIINNESFDKTDQFKSLLNYLAKNIGELFSISKVSRLLGLNDRTTMRYLKILQDYDIIFQISGYKNRSPEELTRFNKYYFTDLGVRNAIINDFSTTSTRRDTFALWENFLFSERRKYIDYHPSGSKVSLYYWRTYSKLELCCVEAQKNDSGEEKIFSYRFSNRPVNAYLNAPRPFIESYPKTIFKNVTPKNCLEFLLCPII
ncbi:MAG: DUF4143 domain-containing protein [Candidatus Ancillula sp.]|nr:DUF4143 domain-containing protein [Candidatus Ancillula sp.]